MQGALKKPPYRKSPARGKRYAKQAYRKGMELCRVAGAFVPLQQGLKLREGNHLHSIYEVITDSEVELAGQGL